MGRLPKRKRKGYKDPYKQEEVRLNRLKNKVDKEPPSAEVQEIPRKLQLIANFNKPKRVSSVSGDAATDKKKSKQTQIAGSKNHGHPGKTQPTKKLPALKQNPNESDKMFLRRVNQMTKVALADAAMRHKALVKGMRGKRGQVKSAIHQEKINPQLSQENKTTNRKEKRKLAKKERELRKKLKRKKDDDDDDDDDDEFKYFQDKVEFGEVVDEPPSLDTTKLTRKVSDDFIKPRSFLFMKELKNVASPVSSEGAKQKKNINDSRNRTLVAERGKAVDAYRKMKAARSHAVSLSEFM